MFNRLLWLCVSFIFLVPIHLHAQYQIIEIEKVQLATSLAAVVTDITGSRMPGVLVEEFSSDWKQSLRSTKTDATVTDAVLSEVPQSQMENPAITGRFPTEGAALHGMRV